MTIPAWFASLSQDPANLKQNFIKIVSQWKKNSRQFEEVIDLFGRWNEPVVAKLLAESAKTHYQNKLQDQQRRMAYLFKNALPALIAQSPLPQEIYAFYRLPFFSPHDTRKKVIHEFAQYLLSFPMPLQEARRLGCYAVPHLQMILDEYQRKQDEILNNLFQSVVSVQAFSSFSLSLEKEQLLFKHVAIQGHGRLISWAEFVGFWMMHSQHFSPLVRDINERLHFNKILLSEIPSPPSEQLTLSFQEFLHLRTFEFVFQHPQAILYLKSFDRSLQALFSACDKNRQTLMYFMDFLHKQYKKGIAFDASLKTLKALVDDQQSPLYNFLHTALHFFQARSLCQELDQEGSAFLFNAIHSLSLQQRQAFDTLPTSPIQKPIILTADFVCLAKGLGMGAVDWGFILLQAAYTPLKPAPYLSLQERMGWIQKMKQDFGIQLPSALAADFLFFQTTQDRVFSALDNASGIKALILSQYLDTLAIPRDLYQSWLEIGSSLMDCIDAVPKGTFSAYFNDRIDAYSFNVLHFIGILQMAIYPSLSFSHWIPSLIKEKEFIFSHPNMHGLECLNVHFPNGPGRQCQWIFPHDDTHSPCLLVSFFKSMQDPQACFSFQVPLSLPSLGEDAYPVFFNLLALLVDKLGADVLTEEDELALKDITDQLYEIPLDVILLKSTPEEEFDAFLAYSPLLRRAWEEAITAYSEMDQPFVKTSLYTFIRSLRTQAKKAYYTAFDAI